MGASTSLLNGADTSVSAAAYGEQRFALLLRDGSHDPADLNPPRKANIMAASPVDVVRAILDDPTDLASVTQLVAADATYVSLNYDNPELKKLMPWAGTQQGPEAIVSTYAKVGRYWKNEGFEIRDIFGAGENIAVFGSFTYRSTTLGKAITSPFSILAKVHDGRVTYMQFMEDTFGTASTFRTGGTATYRADPEGGEVEA